MTFTVFRRVLKDITNAFLNVDLDWNRCFQKSRIDLKDEKEVRLKMKKVRCQQKNYLTQDLVRRTETEA